MKVTNQQIIAAMKGTGGIMMQIMQNLKMIYHADKIKNQKEPDKISEILSNLPDPVNRSTLYERITKNPQLTAAREEASETIDDLGEAAFAAALQRREPWAVKQWLKYRGRKREYVPAMKLDHTTDDKPLPQPVIFYPAELPYDIVKRKGSLNVSPKEQTNAQQTPEQATTAQAENSEPTVPSTT